MVDIVISPMVNLGFSFALTTFLVPLLLVAHVGNYLYSECIFRALYQPVVYVHTSPLHVRDVASNPETNRWTCSSRALLLWAALRYACVFGIFKW